MDISKFLFECNRSPLLKKYAPITKEILKELDFMRADYTLNDLRYLEQILFFIPPTVIENTDPSYLKQKRVSKDSYHAKLIELYDNKVFIKKLRRELKMPFDNNGFKVLKRMNYVPYLKSFTNFNFETIHPDYKKWFFSWSDEYEFPKYFEEYDKLMEISPLVKDEIFKAVTKSLKKWKLPWRYFDAVQELILFNTLIPADSGIAWLQDFGDERINRMPRFSISFEIDTTKEELIEVIKKDECNVLKNRYKYLAGKIRKRSRKPSETKKMLAIYNKHRKDGKKNKEIFTLIKNNPEFEHLSISAIRDRIKQD